MHQVMGDGQVMLVGDLQLVAVDQLIIGQNSPCDGVFDGHHPVGHLLAGYCSGHFLEGAAFLHLHLFPKVAEGHLMVEGAGQALDGDITRAHGGELEE
ncbi:hypothetical protein A3SI_10109 [Nitritalea halalkaliphila LW7]|uniref:Uncharacterized protein n=1 Tax=Nitritalea halalkaliphila LW7 TaxID=1189621 RepID=I5C3I0_9BACT|nr:hypothetical protein A3SI_10109 [Nitritalea halalkaliphila LW7]